MAKSDKGSFSDVEETIKTLNQPLRFEELPPDKYIGRIGDPINEKSHQGETQKITGPPPKHPRKTSLGSNTPSPLSKSRRRRSSDCVSFITSPARISPTLMQIKPERQVLDGWVTSPVFSGSVPRTRKLSVFNDCLEKVQEEQEEKDDNHKTKQKQENIYKEADGIDSNSNSDYAIPADAYHDQSDLYNELISECDEPNNMPTKVDHLKGDGFNIAVNSEQEMSYIPSTSKLKCDKSCKLSLGVVLRKISTGSMSSLPQRKHSLPERRLRSMLTKVITLPKFVKTFSRESYQVNCDSWEFLNKEEKDVCWNEIMTNTKVVKEGESLESVYESESSSSNQSDRSSLFSCQNITL